jgi:hypothetical protein
MERVNRERNGSDVCRYVGRVLGISRDASPSAETGDGVRRGHRSAEDGPGLLEYLALLRRHRWVALVTFAVVLGASLASLVLTEPVYRAEAQVLLRTADSRQLFPRVGDTSSQALVRSPEAEVLYVRSDEFQDSLSAVTGADAEVQVSNEMGSSALVFEAEANDADAARVAAQAWAETYVAARREQDLGKAADLQALLAEERDRLRAELDAVLQPVTELDEAIAATSDPAEVSLLLNQRLALQRSLAGEVTPAEAELRRLDAEIGALQLERRVLEDPQALARVSTAAALPEERANGSLSQSLLVGVLGGLILGAAAVAAAGLLRRR